MKIKYSKPYGNIFSIKEGFIEHNEDHLLENERIRNLYLQQPKREECKICSSNLESSNSFYSHGIEYYICPKCGHINGCCEETKIFTKKLYIGEKYGEVYRVKDRENWQQRKNNIYLPKAKFLIDILNDEGIEKENVDVLDIGGGSGYFVGALNDCNIKASGIEVSKSQVDYANLMIGSKKLNTVDENSICDYIKKSEVNVISFIGVLEHIVNLKEVICSVNENRNIKYIYFSVPMFSFSVYIEAIFDKVYNRLLGGAHTHIFSNESIKYLMNDVKWQEIGEWRFGTDMADLYRTMMVSLFNNGNKGLGKKFDDNFRKIIDDLQAVVDKNNLCSEIHIVCKKM